MLYGMRENGSVRKFGSVDVRKVLKDIVSMQVDSSMRKDVSVRLMDIKRIVSV